MLPTTVHGQDSHFSPQECVRQSQDDWEPFNNSAQCEQVLVLKKQPVTVL